MPVTTNRSNPMKTNPDQMKGYSTVPIKLFVVNQLAFQVFYPQWVRLADCCGIGNEC